MLVLKTALIKCVLPSQYEVCTFLYCKGKKLLNEISVLNRNTDKQQFVCAQMLKLTPLSDSAGDALLAILSLSHISHRAFLHINIYALASALRSEKYSYTAREH